MPLRSSQASRRERQISNSDLKKKKMQHNRMTNQRCVQGLWFGSAWVVTGWEGDVIGKISPGGASGEIHIEGIHIEEYT